jgi:choline dehydrogenase-like flavoprotein
VAQRKGVQVRAGCRVREITVRVDGMADGVLYYDEEGQLQEQKAEIVVLACNGIGTPRLLLNSRSAQHPDGLANSSGLVGRNLMLHPYAMITGIFEEPLQSRRGPIGCSFWSHEFYQTDRSRGFVRGYSFEAIRGTGPAQTALLGMVYGLVPWGEDHHQAFARLYDHTATLLGITEDLPEETNTVTLDPELTDAHGIPAPKVTYRLSENSRKMLAHAVERGKEALTAAGAVETFAEPLMRNAGWHLMGTARMGQDPRTSVVNERGQAHDVKNLFIVDGSVFVTAGGVNPTSTIQAFALYVADSIKQNIETLFDDA